MRARAVEWTGWKWRGTLGRILAVAIATVGLTGCPAPEAPPEVEPEGDASPVPVRVLVVDDAPLAEALERQWASRADRAVEVRRTTSGELPASGRLQADVIVFPSGLLGQLAEAGQIEPLDDATLDGPQLARRDVFPLHWQTEARWGREIQAAPLGSPTFVLFYRPDLLEASGGELPDRWPEVPELAQRLLAAVPEATSGTASADGKDSAPAVYGFAEPLAEGWAGQTLLARAAPYARHRSHYSTLFDFQTMEPLIDGPAFVRALEELVAARELAPPDSLDWTPGDVRRAFYDGRVLLAVGWPSGAATGAPPPPREAPTGRGAEADSSAAIPVGFAELPGSDEVYSLGEQRWEARGDDESDRVPLTGIAGRLVAVTREARRAGAAADVVAWTCGRDWSAPIATHSADTTLFRQSHVSDPQPWVDAAAVGAAEQYAELVEGIQTRAGVLPSPRIPGRDRYLAALDQAVRAAVRGEASPAEALAEAADRWRQITEELGVERQKEAYARSLGLAP